MDLSTTYLGLKLKSPLVPSAAQPLTEDIDNIRRFEDAGAGAVVLYSLFEEQLRQDRVELNTHLTAHSDSFAEAQTFFPEPEEFLLGPEEYLNHIRKAKEAVKIPIIASLNGSTMGGWTQFAKQMEEAGADAIELNIYNVPTEFDLTATEIEMRYIEILRTVRANIKIPIAVKVSPFFTNMANMAKRLSENGANGLVLFNRFYQPEIDLESLEICPSVLLSTPFALRLPMRWVAILHGRTSLDLAATSGIHRAEDVIKMLMVGANVTMLCSAILRHGIGYLTETANTMREWMEEHEYESVSMMRGSMSQLNCSNPSAFERAQYIKALHSYHLKKK